MIILIWCMNKFGKSKFRKDYPKLRVYKSRGNSGYDNRETGLRGTYWNGVITIYLGSISSVRELCETVIHEYKHYLMSDREYDVLERKLKKQKCRSVDIYDAHPHEKRAMKMEYKWGDVCYRELKNKLYKQEKR